jgi:hypothetical protein
MDFGITLKGAAGATVNGEICVANFIDNFFKQAPLPDTVAVHPCMVVPQGTACTNHQVRQNWLKQSYYSIRFQGRPSSCFVTDLDLVTLLKLNVNYWI